VLGAVLSGSGPTLMALARSRDDAGEIARRVSGCFASVAVVASPAGGAEIRRAG
jgi:homoserine kinase